MLQRLTRLRGFWVKPLVLDESRQGTITPLAEPKAKIGAIYIECKQTDGSWIGMPLFDGVNTYAAKAVPGVGNIGFSTPMSEVYVTNIGSAGNIYCRVADDSGKEIFNVTQYLGAGETTLFPGLGNDKYFDMPNRNYVLTFEVGH